MNKTSSGKEKAQKSGTVLGLLAIITAFVIIGAVMVGVSYYIIHNNIYGLADRYREQIQAIPVLKKALPKPKDPEDPAYMTDAEVRQKYQELRKTRDELNARLEEAKKTIAELQKYKNSYDEMSMENEKRKRELDERQQQIEEKMKQMEEDKKVLDRLIAEGDKEGFKSFFEKVDKANAEKIYAEILEQEKKDEKAREFAKIYENMDPEEAAGIFEELGSSDIDLIVETLINMSGKSVSEVLAAMDPVFASEITRKLSEKYKN